MSEIITGSIEISAGIVFSGLTVDAGGDITVLSGGTVTDAEAINYGYFWVEEGGYIGRIRVTNSGDAMVNGGLAETLTMESGGMADVFSGVMRTAPPGLRNIYGKTKGHGKKWKPRRFYAADYTRPAHVPALLSVRFVLAAVTGRPKHPARLVLSGRAQGDGAGKPRTSNCRIFCTSNCAQITEKLRKTGPRRRTVFAF
jgi:hypothetical protein